MTAEFITLVPVVSRQCGVNGMKWKKLLCLILGVYTSDCYFEWLCSVFATKLFDESVALSQCFSSSWFSWTYSHQMLERKAAHAPHGKSGGRFLLSVT